MRNIGFRIPVQKPSRFSPPGHHAVRWVERLALLGIIAGFSGCSDQGQDQDQDHVIVFAASSLAEPLELIEAEFEALHPDIDLELIFAGSNTLAMQINAGAPADLFISADDVQMHRVKGFSSPILLVENRLVGIAPLESTSTTINDAIKHASRIIVAQGDVPAGGYTRRALDELGTWEAAKPKIVSYEHAVQGVVSKLAFGQGDLGFVYRTDALGAQDQVRMIEFPPDISVDTQTWIAIRTDSADARSGVAVAYEFILNAPESQSVFAHLGFQTLERTP